MRAPFGRWSVPVAVAALAFFFLAGSQLGQAGTSADGYSYLADAGLGPAQHHDRAALPTGSAGAQAVLGTDEREQLTETEFYPFSAIVYLELYDSEGFAGTCSGTFIGPDTVLTAAHCLYGSGVWMESVVVVPGKNGEFEPFGYEYAEDWWVPDAWIDLGEPSDWDWGVIKMEDTFLGEFVGYLYVANLQDPTLMAPDFAPAIVGYPGDKPDGTMWGGIVDAFLTVEPYHFTYLIDTAPGQSGSAIISTQDGPYLGAVVGVHTQGHEDFNSGSRIDQELLDDILLACDVMECTVEYYVEPAGQATPTATATASPTPTTVPAPSNLPRRGLVPSLHRGN